MNSRIHRRDFQKRLTLLLGGASLGTIGGCSPGEESLPSSSGPSHGILSVTRGEADLTTPADVPPGKSWRYGLIFPFQVAPRMAAAFVNIRIRNGVMAPARSGDDYEVGNDVVLFDDINLPPSAPAVPVTRNHEEANPNSNPPHQTAIMVKYPMRGGFIPWGKEPGRFAPPPRRNRVRDRHRFGSAAGRPQERPWGRHVRGCRALPDHGGLPVQLRRRPIPGDR